MRRLGSRLWDRDLVWVAGDLAAALGSFYLAFLVRIRVALPLTWSLLPADRLRFFIPDAGVVMAAQLVLLYLLGFYDPPRQRQPADILRRLVTAVAFEGMLLAAYFLLINRAFPRSVLLLFLLLDLLWLVAWRWLLARLRPSEVRRVAIVGTGAAARELAHTIEADRWHGLEVAGFVRSPLADEPPLADGKQEPLPGPRLGEVEDLPRLLEEGAIDDVVLAADADGWRARLLDRLAGVRPSHSSLLLLPGPFESLIGGMRYRWVHDLPLIEVVGESEWHLRQPSKRLLDLALGGALLLVALPVMVACALAVRLTSPGPVFYRQERVGRGRRAFTLWKFRTMVQDAERESGEVLAAPDDPRVTPVGRLLRRSRLDELPQLFNVLGGSMSLVGPRPERPGFVERYLREVPGYAERFSVAPGVTGLAQVNGDYHSSAQNKLRYDLAYLANRSLWLDLSILLRTAKIVLSSRGT